MQTYLLVSGCAVVPDVKIGVAHGKQLLMLLA